MKTAIKLVAAAESTLVASFLETRVMSRGGGNSQCNCGRDVPPKGNQFSEFVWDGGIFHCTNSGKGSNIPVWKGVPACLKSRC